MPAGAPIDPPTGFRAELDAALNALAPEIIGLEDLASAGLSEGTTGKISEVLAMRVVRRGLITEVIHALDVVLEKWMLLKADGYPELVHENISEEIATELQNEETAIMAAIAIFKTQLRASKMTATLGEALPKQGI